MGKVYVSCKRGPRGAYETIDYSQQAYGVINLEELREWLK